MPLYRYKAIAANGAVLTGKGEARDTAALAEQLRAHGHFPVSAVPAEAPSSRLDLSELLRFKAGASRRVLTTMTQELATLLGAGLELDRALGILAGLADIKALHEPLAAARQRVRGGASLADALAKEEAFPAFYVNMIRAGETGGALAPATARLADYLARSLAVRDAIGSALVYPAILLITAGLSITIILTLVLPEFAPLFAESGRSLPWMTQMLMDLSSIARDFWWLFALMAAGAFLGARAALRRPDMRLKTDTALLRLPVFGDLLRAMEIERFCRTLGMLAGNGVALPAALTLSADVLWNKALRHAVADAAASLREGESLSPRLARTGMFPALTLDLVRVGEETGQLDVMLLKQADLDEQRTRHALDRLLALLVPVLTIVLGIVVAGLIASMLVAILSVNDLAIQ